MTAPSVQVTTRAMPGPEAALYPLATKTGIELLGLVLAAYEHWQPLTRRQRSVLRAAAHEVFTASFTAMNADGVDAVEVELPRLAAGTHPLTVASLQRRHLAHNGRITLLGVQVVQYGDRDDRPARTTQPAGDVL
ncbi:MAG: hypothetical protein ACRCZP_01855 [Phycicoccus sp.]